MSAHTPGPWALDGAEIAQHDGKTVLAYYVNQPRSGGRIGKTFANCLVTTDAEVLANARLLAIAPELLEALEDIDHAWNCGDVDTDKMFDAMARARPLVVKARGRGIGALLSKANPALVQDDDRR